MNEAYHSNMELIKVIAFFALAAAFTHQVSYNFLINMYKIKLRAKFALAFQAYFIFYLHIYALSLSLFDLWEGSCEQISQKTEIFGKFGHNIVNFLRDRLLNENSQLLSLNFCQFLQKKVSILGAYINYF